MTPPKSSRSKPAKSKPARRKTARTRSTQNGRVVLKSPELQYLLDQALADADELAPEIIRQFMALDALEDAEGRTERVRRMAAQVTGADLNEDGSVVGRTMVQVTPRTPRIPLRPGDPEAQRRRTEARTLPPGPAEVKKPNWLRRRWDYFFSSSDE